MTQHHSTLRTPLLKDKRFLLTLFVFAFVLTLVALNRTPNEQVLTFLAEGLVVFVGASQYGQTKRTTELLKAATAPKPPAEPPAP